MTWPRLETRFGSRASPASRYDIDDELDAFVDSAVDACRAHGDSLDDTVDAIAHVIRSSAPNELAQTDPEWERRWRTYFTYYDHAVMHAIRTYVERDVR